MSDQPMKLPVLPLRDVVLFPGVTLPIAVARKTTLTTVEAAQKEGNPLVFAVAQHEDTEAISPEGLYTLGVVARIDQLQRNLAGLHMLLHGEQRGIAARYSLSESGRLEAFVRPVEEMQPLAPEDPAFLALYREARVRTAELGQKSGLPKEAVQQFLEGIDDPGRLADVAAGYLDLKVAERQSLLETLPVEERLRRVLIYVERQLTVLDAQEDLKTKVQEELGDRQREMFLREQLKAIQAELGEGSEGEDLDELQEKLDSLDLPPEGRKEVDREMRRLARINGESMEAQVIRTYLETVSELPWSETSEEQIDLHEAARILNEDHYGLEDVKDRVLEFLAVRQLRLEQEAREAAEAKARAANQNDSESPEAADGTATADKEGAPEGVEAAEANRPAQSGQAQNEQDTAAPGEQGQSRSRVPTLLFLGPPGVGKTSLAKSIARAMGREYVRISLGGARDEADIRGHRRTYVGAMPGRILQGMKQAGTKNPVFLLDEIDKMGTSFQGDPGAALLEVLDPAQNESFTDHYLSIPFDLSQVLFVCTANFIQGLPGPLLDRMEQVQFDGYTEGEKLAIAQQYLLPRQRRQAGLDEERFRPSSEGMSRLITEYTREAGVRQLEREIGRLARKVARKIAARELEGMEVGPEQVRELLGRPKVHPEKKAEHDQVGVATGMYYTPTGGDIMFVEANTMPGKGRLELTGQLGDVMRESARAAWSYARSHAEALHIGPSEFELDLHIHAPAGAIPKDGPSAGVTMATALVSALSGRPVRNDIAMTGEITLSGRVLPIGGVKEKILGGVRAGIRSFLVPADNQADLEDLPKEVRDAIEVTPVSELGQVLALALRDASYREGRLLFGDQQPEDVVPLSSTVEH